MSTSLLSPTKSKYKISNSKNYNSNLCQRGSLNLFIDSIILKEWEQVINKAKVVGEQTYSDSVIMCCLLVKINYGLALRQSTGFLKSLFSLMGKEELPIPDYTTLSRRQETLPVEIEQKLSMGENLVVGIDSTGLKVYGEGEWKVRKHGSSKHRTWRKLHIGIDLNTQDIISVELTGNNEDDATVGSRMLSGKTKGIKSFHGDGAYDDFEFRAVLGKDIRQVIPPPKNAVIQKPKKNKPVAEYLIQRNEAVEYIQKHSAKQWKEQHDYHRRSLNEVVMFRYKTIFGGELDARIIENQKTEAKLKCLILNKYTRVGMPNSYKVA
jgi:hypothetical protein